MKISCNVIKDLMLIYNEEISEETKSLVDTHMENCKECREYFNAINGEDNIGDILKSELPDEHTKNLTVKKGFKKIRARWIASILIVALLLPVIAVGGRLTVNQTKSKGLRFTNIDEVMQSKNYLKYIGKGNFEKFYEMIDVAGELHRLKEDYESCSSDENLRDFKNIETENGKWCIDENSSLKYESNDTFWERIIDENIEGIFIPEEKWQEIAGDDVYLYEYNWFGNELKIYYPGDVDKEDDFDYHNNPGFIRLETKWGNFYTLTEAHFEMAGEEGCVYAENIIESVDSVTHLYWWMDMIPQEIVNEALEEMQASKKDSIEYMEKEYGDILKMTDEEYVAYRKEQYKAAFESFRAMGYKITDISYIDKEQYVKYDKYDEIVVLHVVVEDSLGNKEQGNIELGIKNKKITVRGSSGGDKIFDALYDMLVC